MHNGRGRGSAMKAKDFKNSFIRLFKDMKGYKNFLILCVVLAFISAILALVAPNKVSELTKTISNGLIVNQEELVGLTTKIYSDFGNINFQEKVLEINELDIDQEKKDSFNQLLMNSQNMDKTLFGLELLKLDDEILLCLLNDVEYKGTIIKNDEVLTTLRVLSSIDTNNVSSLTASYDLLPRTVYFIIKPRIDFNKIKSIALFLAILYVSSSLIGFVQSFILATISNKYANNLRNRVTKKSNSLPLKYFDTHESGDIISRITNDIDLIGHNLNQSLSSLVSNATLFVGSVIMMFYTNPVLAIVAILASMVGLSFMFVILGKSQKYFNQRQKELGDLNGYIEEVYQGHHIMKLYNGESESIKKFESLNGKLYDSNKKSRFLSGLMQPIMGFVGDIGYVTVCIVGAYLVMNNGMEFVVIIAFLIYIRLFNNSLSQIAQSMSSVQTSVASGERVFEYLDEEELSDEKELKSKLSKDKVKGNIDFVDVKFGYEPGKLIIKNFNASVMSGQKIAIVGPTGSGKTTIVNLLMKFYEINSGDIVIDGVSIHDLKRENIHDLFTMVLQDTWLFEGTIRENMVFNKKHISDEKIWEVLKYVGVDHFVKTLPNALDSKIDSNNSISQGQKQLLTISRGMLEDAPFLILDEATSNVDTRTEELVQKSMDRLMKGKTSFIIAHRLSTIKDADLILVMKNGNIIEAGSHESLMKLNGFYTDLYNSQFTKNAKLDN